jgi:DNA polymerase III alpha subunit (gram-positive type)
MSYIVVDVEADGPIPHEYSMVCFGAIVVDESLDKTFYGKTKPISQNYIKDALAVSGFSREEHMEFDDPKEVMENFEKWLKENSKNSPVFISDNNGFDWQWINFYFHKFLGRNPFGFSSRRIGDLYCGLVKNGSANREWKRKYRITRHTHNPVDDAKGNAEALLAMKNKLDLKIKF